jgi:hypothetical protein
MRMVFKVDMPRVFVYWSVLIVHRQLAEIKGRLIKLAKDMITKSYPDPLPLEELEHTCLNIRQLQRLPFL